LSIDVFNSWYKPIPGGPTTSSGPGRCWTSSTWKAIPLLFRTVGGADGALATIVHVPDMDAICSGDIVYHDVHMWLWRSTPASREAWLASLDAVATLKPSTIITGPRDPDAPDDDATRVLDQSRRYIEDFGQAVARSGTAPEVIDAMLAKYPAHGNRYTLFVAAFSQFPS
jgi:hypothetical protein